MASSDHLPERRQLSQMHRPCHEVVSDLTRPRPESPFCFRTYVGRLL